MLFYANYCPLTTLFLTTLNYLSDHFFFCQAGKILCVYHFIYLLSGKGLPKP